VAAKYPAAYRSKENKQEVAVREGHQRKTGRIEKIRFDRGHQRDRSCIGGNEAAAAAAEPALTPPGVLVWHVKLASAGDRSPRRCPVGRI